MSHYSLEGAQHYAAHHDKNLRTRFTTYRERQLLTRALRRVAGERAIDAVLDLPCGTGRFWPVLLGTGAHTLIAADNSDGMLQTARACWPAWAERMRLLNTSVFAIDLPDASVDVACCMRFFHHLALAEDRLRALAELHRVARSHAVVSLWVDGNLRSLLRARRAGRANRAGHAERTPPAPGYGPRRCLPRATVEAEFVRAGFAIDARFDLAPGLSMWRTYLLRRV